MKKYIFILITSLLVFSNSGYTKTKTAKNLEREITKLTKLSTKQETKISKLTTNYQNYFEKSKTLKEKGEQLIELGKKGQLESLNEYVSFVEQMGKAQNSKTLKQELKLLKAIQSSWQGFEKNIKSGESDINKSSKFNNKAIKVNDEVAELIKKFEKNKTKLIELKQQKIELGQRR